MFADDLFVFSKADIKDLANLMGIIKFYESYSGQMVSLRKSCYYLPPHINVLARDFFLHLLKMESMTAILACQSSGR